MPSDGVTASRPRARLNLAELLSHVQARADKRSGAGGVAGTLPDGDLLEQHEKQLPDAATSAGPASTTLSDVQQQLHHHHHHHQQQQQQAPLLRQQQQGRAPRRSLSEVIIPTGPPPGQASAGPNSSGMAPSPSARTPRSRATVLYGNYRMAHPQSGSPGASYFSAMTAMPGLYGCQPADGLSLSFQVPSMISSPTMGLTSDAARLVTPGYSPSAAPSAAPSPQHAMATLAEAAPPALGTTEQCADLHVVLTAGGGNGRHSTSSKDC